MAKLTKLIPVLAERTCERCKDGLIKYKRSYNTGNLFKSKIIYEYECENCGEIIKTDKHLKLQKIIFIDPNGKKILNF